MHPLIPQLTDGVREPRPPLVNRGEVVDGDRLAGVIGIEAGALLRVGCRSEMSWLRSLVDATTSSDPCASGSRMPASAAPKVSAHRLTNR